MAEHDARRIMNSRRMGRRTSFYEHEEGNRTRTTITIARNVPPQFVLGGHGAVLQGSAEYVHHIPTRHVTSSSVLNPARRDTNRALGRSRQDQGDTWKMLWSVRDPSAVCSVPADDLQQNK